MKVAFLVKGDEGKAAAEACAESYRDGMTLKVNRFGNGLHVVEGIAAADGLEGAVALSEFLESVDKKLGRAKKDVRQVRILADDASALFGGLLYPALCKFEVRLRAAIDLAMCADEDNFDNKLVATLDSFTLEQLKQQLFDDCFAPKVVKALKEKDLNKQKLLSYVESLQEGCVWDDLFAGDELRAVRDGFAQIKERRNDVMHFHTISYKTYVRGKEVLEAANAELDAYVNHALADDRYPVSREAAAQAASRQLAGNYAAMVASLGNVANTAGGLGGNFGQLRGIIRALEQFAEIGKPARSALDETLSTYDLSGIVSALSRIDFGKVAGNAPALDLSQSSAYTDAAKKLGEAASAVSGDAAKGMGSKLAAVSRDSFAGAVLDQGQDEDAGNVAAAAVEGKGGNDAPGLAASNEKDGA